MNGRYMAAFRKKQSATPTVAINTPAMAGPMMREALKAAALSATALCNLVLSTSAGTIESRAGQSNPEAVPTTMAMTMMCQTCTRSVATSVAKNEHCAGDDELDTHEDLAAVDPIEQRAGDRRCDQDWGGLEKADQTEQKRVVRQLVDKPPLGRDAHPDTGQRKEDGRPEEEERTRLQRYERPVQRSPEAHEWSHTSGRNI